MSYSGPSGAYPVYAGSRRQVGGGILGSIGRLVLPSLKRVALPLLKRAGRSLLEVGTNAAADALSGRNFKDSLQQHSRTAALDALGSLNTRLNKSGRNVGLKPPRRMRRRQVGSGRITKQTRRRRKSHSKRIKSTARKSKTRRTRKRRTSVKGPASKRRKTSYF